MTQIIGKKQAGGTLLADNLGIDSGWLLLERVNQ